MKEHEPVPEKQKEILVRISGEQFHAAFHESLACVTKKISESKNEEEAFMNQTELLKLNIKEQLLDKVENDCKVIVRYYINIVNGELIIKSYPKERMGFKGGEI